MLWSRRGSTTMYVAARHVAVDALRACRSRLVPVVRAGVVLRRIVALRTHRVARGAQLLRVRIVAVAAGDAGRVHPALQPRAPDEHLVLLLPVGVIQPWHQQRRQVVIHERSSGLVPFGDLGATRMALRADFDFALGGARLAARRLARRSVARPGHAAPLVELHRQALACVRALAPGPFDVRGAGSVARLATHRNFGVCRLERIRSPRRSPCSPRSSGSPRT